MPGNICSSFFSAGFVLLNFSIILVSILLCFKRCVKLFWKPRWEIKIMLKSKERTIKAVEQTDKSMPNYPRNCTGKFSPSLWLLMLWWTVSLLLIKLVSVETNDAKPNDVQ